MILIEQTFQTIFFYFRNHLDEKKTNIKKISHGGVFMRNVKYFLFFTTLFFTTALLAQGSWHPEYTHWPRTILEENELDAIRDRISYTPYSESYGYIEAISDIDYTACEMERDKAEVCRSAAFRYLMESDISYADKAKEYLLEADREPSSGYTETYENIIWDSENLTAISTAYDFLKGNDYDFTGDETAVRNQIQAMVSSLYDDIMNDYIIHIAWEAGGKKTNFGAKLASALGIAAIVLNTETSEDEIEQPITWINYGMNLLHDSYYDYLVDADGGWAECAHYQKFTAFNIIPFAIAHNNFVNGQTEDYDETSLPPILLDERFQMNAAWGIRIRMPNGARPNFDDCFFNPYYFNGFFAGYFDDDVFAWDYINSGDPYNTYASPGDLDIEMICVYDDNYTGITEPEYLTQFLPDAGQAIFRSSWEENAIYMCLIGENGIAREGGRAHEHPDNMSFIIYAYGELLAMDSGYINFDQHDLVRYAKNHSLILVDEEGPSAATLTSAGGTDAFITNYFDTEHLDYSEVWTTYEDTDFMRCVSFIDDSYFIIADFVDGTGTHFYDWLLHGNGGGDTGNDFVLTTHGSKYTVNGIDLNFFINSDEDISLDDYYDFHEGGYDIADEHTVTEAAVEGEDVIFSAFLIPAPETRDIVYTPINSGTCIGGTISMDDEKIISLVKSNTDFVSIDYFDIDVGFNGYILNISRINENIPGSIFLKQGQNLEYDNVALINCSESTNLSLNIGTGLADGYISTGCQVQFFTGNLPTDVIGATTWSYNIGVLTANFPDETYFEIEVDWSLVNLSSENNIVSILPELYQNYPNPFNPSGAGSGRSPTTTISFEITTENTKDTELVIYNLKGQKIKMFNVTLSGVEGSIQWDGTDDNNKPVSSGIYLYKLHLLPDLSGKTSNYSNTKKMILLR
jgi:hypothetical protein